ncbi:hypothetical protein ERX37_07105 [Macrococcus hajekii]|uniref:Uncharacterized protein n=1 Tax=Macrococcus hajekii TaxID=198482 RepID=A0A4R6BK08_9STAP|nr:hypothetical protein [Macrococcus hajekii]TDM01970.1 hypothetical protein ERX37_07105 [Macrococcus hajekii]GGB08944.1 hypothetical protein GCM10007190_16230 [Macrococcus hajekii]
MRRLISAILTSVALYLILSLLDEVWHTQTVRLLLNVDFLFDHLAFHWELLLHIIVGILLYYTLVYFYHYTFYFNDVIMAVVAMFMLLYFLLSELAVTISLNATFLGFTIWMIGHLLYLVITLYVIREE